MLPKNIRDNVHISETRDAHGVSVRVFLYLAIDNQISRELISEREPYVEAEVISSSVNKLHHILYGDIIDWFNRHKKEVYADENLREFQREFWEMMGG